MADMEWGEQGEVGAAGLLRLGMARNGMARGWPLGGRAAAGTLSFSPPSLMEWCSSGLQFCIHQQFLTAQGPVLLLVPPLSLLQGFGLEAAPAPAEAQPAIEDFLGGGEEPAAAGEPAKEEAAAVAPAEEPAGTGPAPGASTQ